MKLIFLFSKTLDSEEKIKVVRRFKRRGVITLPYFIDEFIYIGKEINNAIMIYGIRDNEVEKIKQIRQHFTQNNPILVLGQLSKVAKIKVLEDGADFYLPEKTASAEILRVLQSLQTLAKTGFSQQEIQVRDLQICLKTQDAYRQKRHLRLSNKEYQILSYLAFHAGSTITKDELLYELWLDETQINENTLEVLIHRLRQKLDPSKLDTMIETVYGVGYRLE